MMIEIFLNNFLTLILYKGIELKRNKNYFNYLFK